MASIRRKSRAATRLFLLGKRLLGHAHQDTFKTKANLAMALLGLRYVDKAQSYTADVFTRRAQQLEKGHSGTLSSLYYLSKNYNETGQVKKRHRNAGIGRASRGQEPPDVATDRRTLECCWAVEC